MLDVEDAAYIYYNEQHKKLKQSHERIASSHLVKSYLGADKEDADEDAEHPQRPWGHLALAVLSQDSREGMRMNQDAGHGVVDRRDVDVLRVTDSAEQHNAPLNVINALQDLRRRDGFKFSGCVINADGLGQVSPTLLAQRLGGRGVGLSGKGKDKMRHVAAICLVERQEIAHDMIASGNVHVDNATLAGCQAVQQVGTHDCWRRPGMRHHSHRRDEPLGLAKHIEELAITLHRKLEEHIKPDGHRTAQAEVLQQVTDALSRQLVYRDNHNLVVQHFLRPPVGHHLIEIRTAEVHIPLSRIEGRK